MAARKIFAGALFCLLCLGIAGRMPLYGNPEPREDGKEGSYWDYSLSYDEEGNPWFSQILVWEENPYALRYVVEIRKKFEDPILIMESVDKAEIAVTLAPGDYEYRITLYNLLDLPEAASPWIPLVIRKAEQPEVYSIMPAVFYLEDPVSRVSLQGSFLDKDARIVLLKGNTEVFKGAGTINESGSLLVLDMPEGALDVGSYDILVTNPGGLYYLNRNAFKVSYRKPADLYFSVGYAPKIPIYDEWYRTSWERGFQPAGFTLRAGSYFIKRRAFFVGLEVKSELMLFSGGKQEAIINSEYLSAGLNFLGQYMFTRSFTSIFRTGVNLFWSRHVFDYKGTSGKHFYSLDPALSAGLSLKYHLTKNIYLEGGFEWSQIFHSGFNAGFLSPLVLFGLYY